MSDLTSYREPTPGTQCPKTQTLPAHTALTTIATHFTLLAQDQLALSRSQHCKGSLIVHSSQSSRLTKAHYFSPWHLSITGKYPAMLQLMRKDQYLPLYLVRYSCIQLSELDQYNVKEFAQAST